MRFTSFEKGMKCPSCNHVFHEGSTSCSFCGCPLIARRVPKVGKPDDARSIEHDLEMEQKREAAISKRLETVKIPFIVRLLPESVSNGQWIQCLWRIPLPNGWNYWDLDAASTIAGHHSGVEKGDQIRILKDRDTKDLVYILRIYNNRNPKHCLWCKKFRECLGDYSVISNHIYSEAVGCPREYRWKR